MMSFDNLAAKGRQLRRLLSEYLDRLEAAIGDIVRARGLSELAREVGISPAELHKALREGGYPSFATVLGVLKALGVKLRAEPVPASQSLPTAR